MRHLGRSIGPTNVLYRRTERPLKPDSPRRPEIREGIKAGYLNVRGKPRGAGNAPFGIIPN
jgi:hypothetical protein